MTEIQVVTAYLRALHTTLIGARERDEAGEIAGTVILVAIFAAGAITIGGIIIAKFVGKANSIPTGP